MKKKCTHCDQFIEGESLDLLLTCPHCNAIDPFGVKGLSKKEEERIINHLWKKLRLFVIGGFSILTAILTTITICTLLLKFYSIYQAGCSELKTLMVNKVAREFETPRITDLMHSVASEEAKTIITDIINPEVDKFRQQLSEKSRETEEAKTRAIDSQNRMSKVEANVQKISSSLLDSLDEMQDDIINIKNQYKPLDLHIASVDKQAYLLGLYFSAYLGDRDAYKKLANETSNKNAHIADYAVVLKSNIDNYYNLYKIDDRNLRIVQFGKKPNIPNYRPSAEIIYYTLLKSDNPQQREAEINSIHDRNLMYFSEFLVSIVTNDPNIKVSIMASRALGKFANEEFSSVPPYNDIDQWWHKYGWTNDLYMMPFKLIDKGNEEIKTKKYDNAIKLFEQAIKGKQGFGPTLYTMAQIYLNKGEKEKAMNALKRISEECDAQEAAMILYAKMLIQDGDIANAVNVLKQIKPFMDDFKSIQKDPAFSSVSTNAAFNKLFE